MQNIFYTNQKKLIDGIRCKCSIYQCDAFVDMIKSTDKKVANNSLEEAISKDQDIFRKTPWEGRKINHTFDVVARVLGLANVYQILFNIEADFQDMLPYLRKLNETPIFFDDFVCLEDGVLHVYNVVLVQAVIEGNTKYNIYSIESTDHKLQIPSEIKMTSEILHQKLFNYSIGPKPNFKSIEDFSVYFQNYGNEILEKFAFERNKASASIRSRIDREINDKGRNSKDYVPDQGTHY